MKKFIAPEVKVVRYDSSSLCATSIGMGDDYKEDEGPIEFDAPGRRRSIFDNSQDEAPKGRL